MAICSGYGVCHKGLESVIIFEFFRDEELQAVVGCGLQIPFISFSIHLMETAHFLKEQGSHR